MKTDRPPETVREYLDALRNALKGASPGLISDALADAEEHLQGEIASNPTKSEAEVLASVIETYGTPEEIAEEYRSMESAIAGPFPKPQAPPERRYGFFSVIRDPRAYGALLYMLLSLATGIFYFVWATVGISLSAAFAILIIGVPFALLFIGSVRILAHVEGRIVEGLLGVRMPRRLPAQSAADERLMARIGAALADIRTWSSLLYLFLMLPLGIAYFVTAVVGIAVSIGLVGGSLFSLVSGHSHVQITDVPWLDHMFHTAPGLLFLLIVGGLLFFCLLHAARGIGWFHGRVAELLLVRL
ncbi:MAG TPA: sensor domain-containing protein [Rhizomicrobium sp.]|nr:sensor domain-containing protein [Rhizomicrobium sp.]